MSAQIIKAINYISNVTIFTEIPVYEFFVNVEVGYKTFYKISDTKAVYVETKECMTVENDCKVMPIVDVEINVKKI